MPPPAPQPNSPKPTQPGGSPGDRQGGDSTTGGYSWYWNGSAWVWQGPTSVEATGNGTPSLNQITTGSATPQGAFAGAPGASLDTSGADAQNANTQALIDALQQQAATGDGSWEKTLAAGTQATQSAASALGQNENQQGGVGYASALRNIQNAQSGASQQAAGEANTLRAQNQQAADSQLADIFNTQGNQDLQQTVQSAADLQAVREADAAKAANDANQASNVVQSTTQALQTVAAASKGGKVPGKPRVFGDSEKNDTVPAMLSPGEIVVPRTMAKNPRTAAAFARAVAMRHGRRMADGGWTPGQPDPTVGNGNILPGVEQEAPSVQNGAILYTGQSQNDDAVGAANFDNNAAENMSLANIFSQNRIGNGPSLSPQMITNASDNSIAGAMGQQQRASAAAANMSQALRAQQAAGGNAAQQTEKESNAAGVSQGNIYSQQRAREMALEQAQQQELWRNSELNSGIGLQQQQEMLGILSGAGQGAVALSNLTGGSSTSSPSTPSGSNPTTQAAADSAFDQSPPGDFPVDNSGTQTAAHGGMMFARGGTVADALMRRYADGGTIHTGSIRGHDTMDKLRADYDAEQARRAIAKGPDMAYRARQFVDAVQRNAGNAGAMLVPATAAAAPRPSFAQQIALMPRPVVAPAPVVQQPVAVPMPPPMAPTQPLMAMPVAPRRPVAPAVMPAPMERPVLEDLEIQHAKGGEIHPLLMVLSRAYGGPVRRYAEGGGVDVPMISDRGPVAVGMDGAPLNYTPAPPVDAGTPALVPVSNEPANIQIPAAPSSDRSMMTQAALDAIAHPIDTAIEAGKAGLVPGVPGYIMQRAGEEEARAAAGIKPGPAPAKPDFGANLTPDAAADAAARPSARSGATAEKPLDASAFDHEQEAVTQQGETKAHQAVDEANALTAYHQQLQSNALAQQDQVKKAHEDASALMAKYNTAVDEMKHIDTSVDPGRFWATRTTAQKVTGIIGMALSALGSRDGTNSAADLLGKAIDRDIDAQKTDVTARLRKGEAALSGAQTAYGMNRQLFQDDLAATAATKASMLDLADNQLKTVAATYASPLAKQQAAQLSAQLQASKQKFIQQAQTQAVENGLKRAETSKAYAEAGKDARGAGINPAEVKDLHTAEATAQDSLDLIRTIRGSLDRAQSPVPGKTAYNENLGEEAPALGTAATQLTLKLKDMAKLGQISATDQALLDKLLGDPQAVWGRGSSEQAKQSRLTALEGIVKRSVLNQRRAALGIQAQ